jgi:hypothetical protein
MTTFIFGDSFIGPFKLVDDSKIRIYKFTGATMKGITKKEHKNRKKIINILSKNPNPKCIIFNFGQVDLYLSYYYDKFIKNKRFMMESIIKKYIEFINTIDCNNCNKIVIAVYPTTLKDKNVFKSLLKYNVLSEDVINSIDKSDIEKTSNFKFRYNMYIKFNNLLEKYCKIYNINYINLDNLLLNKNKKLKDQYINHFDKDSIHLHWEPLIPILIKKVTTCKIKQKYKINLKKSLAKYLKWKKKIAKMEKEKSRKKNN